MKKNKLITCLFIFTLHITIGVSQNLLDTSTWTIGSGSVSGFSQNGVSAENSRDYYTNYQGNEVIIWKATPNSGGSASGGWNTSYHQIDNAKTYRFSVWIKKTNSNTGSTYFGCSSYSNGHQILTLNNTTNSNPYFWYGDLPQLNKWYLLVGYVREATYSSSISLGGIYDPDTQQKVVNMTDFKFSTNATNLRHRAYLYWSSNPNDNQYFFDPRIDPLNGNEPTLSQLFLQVNEDSILEFTYDTAGNQVLQKYCANGECTGRISEQIKEKQQVAEEIEDEEILSSNDLLTIYPNPTKDKISISSIENTIKTIHVFDLKGALINTFNYTISTSKIEIDLLQQPVGIYYLHLHFENGDMSFNYGFVI